MVLKWFDPFQLLANTLGCKDAGKSCDKSKV